MNVFPIILLIAIIYVLQLITYTDIHINTSVNIINSITFPLMANTNMTCYTYIPVIVFLQVLLGP